MFCHSQIYVALDFIIPYCVWLKYIVYSHVNSLLFTLHISYVFAVQMQCD